jgi:hypothetical protein
MLTDIDFEVPSFGFTAMDSAADNIESASLIFAIPMMPRSTSWKMQGHADVDAIAVELDHAMRFTRLTLYSGG